MVKSSSDLLPPAYIPPDPPQGDEQRLPPSKDGGPEVMVVADPNEPVPPGDSSDELLDVIPKVIKENPADRILADNKLKFPNASEDVLTGADSPSDWEELGREFRPKVLPNLKPGSAPLVLGPLGPDSKVVLMPAAGVEGPDVSQKIQNKIKAGEALYQRIMAGDPPPPDKKDAALLMWYLQALAAQKSSPSEAPEGGLVIEDPDRRLEDYLQSFNTYQRPSTHFENFQNLPGCDPRGLDIRGLETPDEKRSLLFSRLPSASDNPQGPNMGDKSLLFIKMEDHGCRGLFSLSGTGEKSGFRQGVKRFFANFRDYVGHIRDSKKNGPDEGRLSRQVTLTQADLNIGPIHQVGAFGPGPMPGQGQMSGQTQALTLAGMQYILADMEQVQEKYLGLFKRDSNRSSYSVGDGFLPKTGSVEEVQTRVNQAIDDLVAQQGDPQEVATALKMLAQQGTLASLSKTVIGDGLASFGAIMPLSSMFGALAGGGYELTALPGDDPNKSVYRLSAQLDSDLRPAGNSIIPIAVLDEDGREKFLNLDVNESFLHAEMNILITYNKETGEYELAFENAPHFEYKLTPGPDEA